MKKSLSIVLIIGILSFGPSSTFAAKDAIVSRTLQLTETTELLSLPEKSTAIETLPSGTLLKTKIKNGNYYKVLYNNKEGWVDQNQVKVLRGSMKLKPGQSQKNQTYFTSCKGLREVYSQGVVNGHPAYSKKLDSNANGWACDPH